MALNRWIIDPQITINCTLFIFCILFGSVAEQSFDVKSAHDVRKHVMQKQRAPVLGVRGGDIGTQSAKRAREASDAWAAAIASATGKSPPNSPPASPTSPASPDGGRRVNLNVKRQDGHESFDAALAAVGAEPRSPHRQRVLQRGSAPGGFSRAKSPERLF